ncbi:bifunctional phosphoglucose/phosphomannose isomerase [Candidatus Woesebacteria bacterium]|nr:bifunctional phosphoglucose/phosphomannose isomerase [Candidatus Woesebacteria bacterium]QQG47171.1 MAG: bifunctional phosphoglucose/phosphomannose isomerase [Candidatus Woesebacteria bacterium]
MINLNLSEEIETADKGKILESIRSLDGQISQVLEETKAFYLPDSYKDILNVVVCGMGGSALGGRIVKALTTPASRIPIEIITDYTLPYYVGEKTLVILSSYSGNTEETISTLSNAQNKGAKIFGVTTGGKLKDLLIEAKLPAYLFNPKNNPSGQPRMALGYSIAINLVVLAKLGAFNVSENDLKKAVKTSSKFIKLFDSTVTENENIAKKLAQKLYLKAPILFASGHLLGIAHAFKNQVNENSKTFSTLFDLPEANHHLLEGFGFPKSSKHVFHFLFFESKNYTLNAQKRYPITEDVVKKEGYEFSVYKTLSKEKLEEIFEILVLGSYLSFYLALLNEIDPSQIPWVDYFKKELAK